MTGPVQPAPAAGARAPGTVVYPSGTVVAPAFPRDPSPAGSFSAGALLLVAACAAAGLWLWWRRRGGAGFSLPRGDRALAVSETRALGNRQYLVVAAYGGRKFLLGVCPGRIQMLSPLDADGPEPR